MRPGCREKEIERKGGRIQTIKRSDIKINNSRKVCGAPAPVLRSNRNHLLPLSSRRSYCFVDFFLFYFSKTKHKRRTEASVKCKVKWSGGSKVQRHRRSTDGARLYFERFRGKASITAPPPLLFSSLTARDSSVCVCVCAPLYSNGWSRRWWNVSLYCCCTVIYCRSKTVSVFTSTPLAANGTEGREKQTTKTKRNSPKLFPFLSHFSPTLLEYIPLPRHFFFVSFFNDLNRSAFDNKTHTNITRHPSVHLSCVMSCKGCD